MVPLINCQAQSRAYGFKDNDVHVGFESIVTAT